MAFFSHFERGLNGVGHQKSLVRCANVLTTVMGLGVVYAILGKFSLLYYGTEDLPDLLDWTAFLSHLFYLVFAFGVFAWFISTLPASCAPIFAMRYLRHC